MASLEISFESKLCNGRCGILKSRGNTLNTPCVFVDTQYGLPTFLTIEQLKKAKLPKHGYVIDLGNIFYLSSTEQIHSSYSQKSKSNKNKNKNKNKNTNTNTNESKDENKDESKDTNESKQSPKDFITTSVLNKFHQNSNTKTKSFHNFVLMEKYMFLLFHQNILFREPQQGTDKFIVLTTDHGNKKITMEEYMHHIQNINADLSIIPSENILSNSSKSRCQKNVNRTLKLLNDGLNYFNNLNIKDSTTIIPSIEGGSDIEQRQKCCNVMMDTIGKIKDVNYGFMVGNIGFGESSVQRNEIFKNVMGILKNDKVNKNKLRVVSGCDTLDDVLLAMYNGVDVIVSGYATKLTEEGWAMVHPICPDEEKEEKDDDDDIEVEDKRKICVAMINVKDICYEGDSEAILKGCECYACVNHSKGYIRHLFNVHEMNAEILLQMHNQFRFLKFVENAKEYLRKDKLDVFCKWWVNYQTKIM